jgi:hypothetical protein
MGPAARSQNYSQKSFPSFNPLPPFVDESSHIGPVDSFPLRVEFFEVT